MLDYLEQHTAIRWQVSKKMGRAADYHPDWRGAMPFGRSVEATLPGGGAGLISEWLRAFQAHGGELLSATPARRLLSATTAQGLTVTGVEAEQGGKPLRIRARRGVLMAAGGFERNDEMKRHFLRGPAPYTLGAESNTGDGIRMGMALGADLRNMNEAWGITAYQADAEANGERRGGISIYAQIERRNPASLCVNRHGQRFCNEGADYDSSWRSFHTWENWGENGYHNIPAFQIFDHSCRENHTIAGCRHDQPLPDWVAVADSLEQLAEKLGIDGAALQTTVQRFNRFAAAGRDPDFHRGESTYDSNGSGNAADALAPLARAPFYGAQVTPAVLGTCGGLRVDGGARVIDVFDRPIAGLYASGNCAGVGGPGALYGGGGGTLGPATTFAYIAGLALTAGEGGAS
jgi:succinate dehydrogenase/fumarate reductase flavoprotein subunit